MPGQKIFTGDVLKRNRIKRSSENNLYKTIESLF